MRCLIAILALAPMLVGWPAVNMGGGVPAPAGGGSVHTMTLDDDFASSSTWTMRGEGTCTQAAGVMTFDDRGNCLMTDGTGGGDNPSTADQWVIAESASTTGTNEVGVAVRLPGTVGAGIAWYGASVDETVSGSLEIRRCTNERTCTAATMGAFAGKASATFDDGDQIALMVTGHGDDTDLEICAWYWDAAGTMPSDPQDPDTWGYADGCLTSDGSDPVALAAWEDCGTGTACQAYGDAHGYPAGTQFGAGLHLTNNAEVQDLEWIYAGDLNL